MLEEEKQQDFIPDRPIQTFEEDELERGEFAKQLARAILDWEGTKSLVVGLFGDWGSGKSSIIELALKTIKKEENNQITTIQLNPWAVAGSSDVVEYFYDELANKIGGKGRTKEDKKIAQKLRLFACKLKLMHGAPVFAKGVKIVLKLLGVAPLLSWLYLDNPWYWDTVFFVLGGLILLVDFTPGFLDRLANMFEARSLAEEKTLEEVKQELCGLLKARAEKLLIVIDDIDRLTQSEIRQLISVVKTNADFPRTIYLLPFDQHAVAACLDAGVKDGYGEKFIEKIVEVSFHVPHARTIKVTKYLDKRLTEILRQTPSCLENFETSRWQYMFSSGLRGMFLTIRDVKRYLNSLAFDIKLLSENNTLEVNPVDFCAIVAIRVFHPALYSVLKHNKDAFTRAPIMFQDNSIKKAEIDEALGVLGEKSRESIDDLLEKLFPIVGSVRSGSNFSSDYEREWRKQKRVCSPEYFDRYFTLIPGGGEEDISEYELKVFFKHLNNTQRTEDILREKIERGRIHQFLIRLMDFTDEESCIPLKYAENLIKGLFNISDDLPKYKENALDLSSDTRSTHIIYETLGRQKDKHKNFDVLNGAILSSKQLFGPVQFVSLESIRHRNQNEYQPLTEESDIVNLQDACKKKIEEFAKDDRLLTNIRLGSILYAWKEWDRDKLQTFIQAIEKDDDRQLQLLNRLAEEKSANEYGNIRKGTETKIEYKELSQYFDLRKLRDRVAQIKAGKPDLFGANRELVEAIIRELTDDLIDQINKSNEASII